METIKFLRRGKGWTQEQLASAVGVKRAVISKYESGAISPSYEMIQKIADALHVPITELIDPPFEAILSSETFDIYMGALKKHLLPLNEKGCKKVSDFAIDYAIDLAKIPEYQKTPPEAQEEATEGE